MSHRRAGIIFLKINGEVQDIKGSATYNLGRPKREAMLGADGIHGYSEVPQVPFIEGEITDRADMDVAAFLNTTDATITIELANGKVITLREAWYAGEGTVGTDEANIQFRFEGMSAEEV